MADRNSGVETDAGAPRKGRGARGQFAKGNPGKPAGARNKATQAVQALLQGEAEALTRKAIDMALAGDSTALRLCIERLAPPPKDVPVRFPLPAMQTAADAASAVGSILSAVAAGDLTPAEAERVAGLIDTWRKAIETADLERRIAQLEARQPNGAPAC